MGHFGDRPQAAYSEKGNSLKSLGYGVRHAVVCADRHMFTLASDACSSGRVVGTTFVVDSCTQAWW